MNNPNIHEQHQALLQLLQAGLPLEPKPFDTIANSLSMGVEEVLSAIQTLQEEKVIRRFSPIYDTKMLGYDSALVAFRIAPSNLQTAADCVSAHPGVSHNYERQHAFNLWFTLATPPDSQLGIEQTAQLLATQAQAQEFAILRSEKTFKIGVKLHLKGHGTRKERVHHKEHQPIPLTDLEKRIIFLTQQPVPIVREPFAAYAQMLELPRDTVLEKLCEFKERGVLRRIAAILHHRKAGFAANGMSVWCVPLAQAAEVGQQMAAFEAVSHCYLRNQVPGWPYNIFAMIHGKSQADVEQVVDAIQRETGIQEHAILYSTTEFKKQRIHYFTPELQAWEQAHATSPLSYN